MPPQCPSEPGGTGRFGFGGRCMPPGQSVAGGFNGLLDEEPVDGLSETGPLRAPLRVVEALRDFAATHQGKLPERLAEITATPAPRDPLTGEPFGYKREPQAIVIAAPGIKDASGTQHNAIELRIKIGQE